MDTGRAERSSSPPEPPDGGSSARRHPLLDARSGWFIAAVLIVFALTRLGMVWWAHSAEDHTVSFAAVGEGGRIDPTGDISIYECITDRIRLDGRAYADVRVEYPPGALPIMTAPQALKELPAEGQCQPNDSYHLGFILLMFGVDAVAVGALVVMARRVGSSVGVWFWVLLLPLLGPVAYSRFDLVPAVAVLLALERAQANRWFGAGGWLGLGTVVKLTPAFVAPATFLIAPVRRRVVYGFAAVVALLLLPWLGVLPDVYEQVLGYHGDRGIQIESLWGSLILALDNFDVPADFAVQFGAFEVTNSFGDTLKTLSNLLAVVALAGTSAIAWLRCRRGSAADLAMVSLGTLGLLVGLGRVYSPQYVTWLLAAAAAAIVLNGRRARWPALLLVVITPMTWWIYPYLYNDIVGRELQPILVLVLRNLLTVGVGVTALWTLLWPARRDTVGKPEAPADEESPPDGARDEPGERELVG